MSRNRIEKRCECQEAQTMRMSSAGQPVNRRINPYTLVPGSPYSSSPVDRFSPATFLAKTLFTKPNPSFLQGLEKRFRSHGTDRAHSPTQTADSLLHSQSSKNCFAITNLCRLRHQTTSDAVLRSKIGFARAASAQCSNNRLMRARADRCHYRKTGKRKTTRSTAVGTVQFHCSHVCVAEHASEYLNADDIPVECQGD